MEAPFNLTHVETDSISTVSQTQWESRKEVTRALYLTQKLPLKQIKVIMARTYSFCATERMYQRQISKLWKDPQDFKHVAGRPDETSNYVLRLNVCAHSAWNGDHACPSYH
ncbi:hypothetical protein CGMCC3_g14413 [Colletotrichum fructicola]|nr:uncharacterized protein CGMCC3_g14413 [Colletotrichum fructicola]KAE9569557.1 hypothetical protein CGMCC3_g14413 [Colletotrichum fructicola]